MVSLKSGFKMEGLKVEGSSQIIVRTAVYTRYTCILCIVVNILIVKWLYLTHMYQVNCEWHFIHMCPLPSWDKRTIIKLTISQWGKEDRCSILMRVSSRSLTSTLGTSSRTPAARKEAFHILVLRSLAWDKYPFHSLRLNELTRSEESFYHMFITNNIGNKTGRLFFTSFSHSNISVLMIYNTFIYQKIHLLMISAQKHCILSAQ